MDYTIWGYGTALVGVTLLLIGTALGYGLRAAQCGPCCKEEIEPVARIMEPVTRPMQAVAQPVEEQPTQVVPTVEATASWEREFDKIMDDAWKTGW